MERERFSDHQIGMFAAPDDILVAGTGLVAKRRHDRVAVHEIDDIDGPLSQYLPVVGNLFREVPLTGRNIERLVLRHWIDGAGPGTVVVVILIRCDREQP